MCVDIPLAFPPFQGSLAVPKLHSQHSIYCLLLFAQLASRSGNYGASPNGNVPARNKMSNIRLLSNRSILYTVFAIRYTISTPPQTTFRSFFATSMEFYLWRRANRIVYSEYSILLCDSTRNSYWPLRRLLFEI